MHASSTASLTASDMAAVLILLAVYLLPAGVAVARRCPRAGRVVRTNVLYGWTGLGWLITLAAALRPRETG